MPVNILRQRINIFLAGFFFLNFLLWFGSSDYFPRWQGVPPVPGEKGAVMMALGDRQFAYRSGALTLQNLGDTGGQTTPLKLYNYEKLGKWFFLLHGLDPVSDHVSMAAAYYFGATRVPKDVRIVVDFLSVAGDSPIGEKWRWLAQASYLARHRLNDLQLSLDLAYKLSKLQIYGTMPMWARQMPAFILSAQGDKQDARALMLQILMSETNIHPNEINFMKAYLIEQTGMSPQEVDAVIAMRGKQQGAPQTAPVQGR